VKPVLSPPDRPAMDVEEIQRALAGPEHFWRVEVVEETGSTQVDLLERAQAGEEAGRVLIAEFQSAGRGRLQRGWQAPARSGVMLSFLLRPPALSPWLTLITAVATRDAVTELTQIPATLKWPNDLVIEDGRGLRKLGGILAEVRGDAVVVGMGINVTLTETELPVENASSLWLEGAEIRREALVAGILNNLAARYSTFIESGPESIRRDYIASSSTIGRKVSIETPAGTLQGIASGIDLDGHLLLDSGVSVAVGDIIHLR
jgi:BirA family transcriptional regulator, biotin operon repressor / biotin---[acetyl-CoA-carboxylase] ligase